MRLGVLDIGSNTIHLLVVDAHHSAAPLPAFSHKVELRLAERLDEAGGVGAALDELVAVIDECLKRAHDLGVTEVMAFATSAIREAPDGSTVLFEVEKRTGVAIEVLSGSEEARLTFLAARRWFGWSSGRLLLLDIGGGSLEVAAGPDEDPAVALSLPFGAGRLTRDFLTSDPVSEDEITVLRRHVRLGLGDVAGAVLRVGSPDRAVATSKTFRSLARVTGAAPSADGPYVRRVLKRSALKHLVDKLANSTASERAHLPGVSATRAPQLVAGALVAEAAMDVFDVSELDICPWALREGVILRELDRMDDTGLIPTDSMSRPR